MSKLIMALIGLSLSLVMIAGCSGGSSTPASSATTTGTVQGSVK